VETELRNPAVLDGRMWALVEAVPIAVRTGSTCGRRRLVAARELVLGLDSRLGETTQKRSLIGVVLCFLVVAEPVDRG
jgi:hypothetical protein